MTDVRAVSDTKSVKNVQEVVDVGVEGGVSAEIEVVGVNTAGADEVKENDGVAASEVRKDSLPGGLVGAEAMGEDEDPVAGSFDADIQSVEDGGAHSIGGEGLKVETERDERE